jgi:hypothetical protein
VPSRLRRVAPCRDGHVPHRASCPPRRSGLSHPSRRGKKGSQREAAEVNLLLMLHGHQWCTRHHIAFVLTGHPLVLLHIRPDDNNRFAIGRIRRRTAAFAIILRAGHLLGRLYPIRMSTDWQSKLVMCKLFGHGTLWLASAELTSLRDRKARLLAEQTALQQRALLQ